MDRESAARYTQYFSFAKPTRYQAGALSLACEALFGRPLSTWKDFYAQMEKVDIRDVHSTFFAAYFFMSSRQVLPDALAQFLPQRIQSYSFDSSLILNRDPDAIIDFVRTEIAPDFEDKLKDSFFKLGGMSAKDIKLYKAKSLVDIVQALYWSPRMRREAGMMHLIGQPVTLFFNEKISGCETAKEIRVMVKDNKIQGISAYHMQGKIRYSTEFIPNAISFLEDRVLPLSKHWQPDFAVDLVERAGKIPQVLEFNPYWTSSPCLYHDWKNIGQPFIIEQDLYGAAAALEQELISANQKLDGWFCAVQPDSSVREPSVPSKPKKVRSVRCATTVSAPFHPLQKLVALNPYTR